MRIRSKKGEIIKKNSHFVYKIDGFSSKILQKYVKSKHITEEIYGFESLIGQDYQEYYTFVPSLERLDEETSQQNWNSLKDELASSTCYELILDKPSFFSLYNRDSIGLFNSISQLETLLFTQVLIRKMSGDYRKKIIPQYEDYLSGNDYPSESRTVRFVQGKVLSVFNRFMEINIPRPEDREMEDKICGDNFQFEVRFILLDGAESEFEYKVNEAIKKMSYQNEVQLVKVRDKKTLLNHIINRQFQYELSSQWLSEQELFCLLTNEKAEVKSVVSKPTSISPIELPQVNEHEYEIDQEIVDQLMDSFKRTKITNHKVKVHSVHRGAALQKVSLTIPSDVVYTKIEKNLKNIQAALGNDAVSVEIGSEVDTVDFYVPVKERYNVYLRSMLDSPQFTEHVKQSIIPLMLGEDSIGNPFFSCLSELKHILIAGATGSGKSVYLNTLILTMLMHKSPDDLQLVLIDPKQVELGQFEPFPHVTFVNDMDEAPGVFESLIDMMEKRYELFASNKCKNIQQYNNKCEKLPYVVCVVDELSDLMDTHGADIEGCIIRLGQKARAAGIHMILCTQKPSADVITTRIKSNLPSAISFRLKAQSDYRTVFGKGIPYHLLGKGDGVAMLEGESKEFIRFQAPVISLDMNEEEEVLNSLLQQYEGMEKSSFEIVEKEAPIDKLKRIIASTGETRISKLQSKMNIRTNDVSDLVKQLVAEDWLVKDGKGYKLIADEGQLEWWRATE